MAFQEKNMQSLFTKWLKNNGKESAAYELKITHTNTLPFSKIAPHQYTELLKVRMGVQVHKISDSAIGYKPYDCYSLYRSPAYLVVMFYKPRQKKKAYLIDILDLLEIKETPGKKSLREEDCIKYGKEIIL